jgi:hypothetical protein
LVRARQAAKIGHTTGKGDVVVGLLLAGVFGAVAFTYVCTEFAMKGLDVRGRVMAGESGLALIVAVNCLSLMLLWIGGSLVAAATGQHYYLQVAAIALGAQAIWLSQHLWFYYRDHLRVHS